MIDVEQRERRHDGEAGAPQGLFGLPSSIGVRELVAIGLMFLIPTAVVPAVDNPTIVPKIALMAPLAVGGLVLLVALARKGDLAARLGLGFLAWSAVSAVLAPSPRFAWLGGYSIDRGVVVLTAYLGCWALGRTLAPAARPYLLGAALLSLGLNVALGVVQLTVDLSGSWLATGEPRAAGLVPSSVYLGGLCAAGMAGAAAGACRTTSARRGAALLLAVGVAALGANLTGSRIAVAAGVALAVAAVVVARAPWRRALLVVGAIVVGLVISLGVPSDGGSTTERSAADPGSGVGTRTEMWGHGVEAWSERPFVGWGAGRFREATSSRITRQFAIDEGPDKLFFDAHNVVVEVLTTTGAGGLLLLGGFALVTARKARGPLAWFAAATAVTWLLEPVSVAVAGPALLALGAAHRPEPPDPDGRAEPASGSERGLREGPVATRLALAGALGGSAITVALIWAGVHVKAASDDLDLAAIDRAEVVYRDEPTIVDLRSQAHYVLNGEDPSPEHLTALLDSTQRAADLDPTSPLWWVRLGTAQLVAEDPEAALESFDRSLERNPWSIRAWYGVQKSARQLGDDERLAEAEEVLCSLDDDFCP